MDGTYKADAGFIETKYIGEEEISVRGPTGRIYSMKPGEPVLVHPMDLNNLRARGVIP
jgi:hypothetical protein